MKKNASFLAIGFLVLTAFSSSAQPATYTVQNAHSHNDYDQATPFYAAYDAGFGSIEADVYPVNGVLLVGHNAKDLTPERTLTKMYIQPLLQKLKKDPGRKVSLLIDIKVNHKESLKLLQKELLPIRKYLVTPQKKDNQVTILISGERPSPADYKDYPGYIYFDDDLYKPHTSEEWKRVGLVSLYFGRYSKWNGKGAIDEKSIDTLSFVIDSVHKAGKKIRFWGAPDNPDSWKLQETLRVDLIGTDNIAGLKSYLMGSSKRSVSYDRIYNSPSSKYL